MNSFILKAFLLIFVTYGVLFYGAYQISLNLGKSKAEITYTKNIRPIFDRTCKACHNRAPFNWMNYKTAYIYRNKIKFRAVTLKDMPPSYWQVKPTDTERNLIKQWVMTGAKE